MPCAICFGPFRAIASPERAEDISIGHRPMKTTIWSALLANMAYVYTYTTYTNFYWAISISL